MKREKKRNSIHKKANQLSFDFNANVPIEIHTPKFDVSNLRKELMWERKPLIEFIKS